AARAISSSLGTLRAASASASRRNSATAASTGRSFMTPLLASFETQAQNPSTLRGRLTSLFSPPEMIFRTHPPSFLVWRSDGNRGNRPDFDGRQGNADIFRRKGRENACDLSKMERYQCCGLLGSAFEVTP